MEAENSSSSIDEIRKEIYEQKEWLNKDNSDWKVYLDALLVKYWKDPKTKAEILDAIDSIKYTE